MNKLVRSNMANKSLFKNFSTINAIKQRDLYFKNLLLSKQTLTPNELSNIARVLVKIGSIEEENKRFDEHALTLSKELDNQQLRQVMSYYIFTKRDNKFVFYELNQRFKSVGYKDFVPKQNNLGYISRTYHLLFDIRNKFFKLVSNVTGIKLQ